MLHAERVGLLLKIDEVDIHGVKAKRKGEFNEFAGTSREWQAKRAEIAKHRGRLLQGEKAAAQ